MDLGIAIISLDLWYIIDLIKLK
jgi:hypothetical protein